MTGLTGSSPSLLAAARSLYLARTAAALHTTPAALAEKAGKYKVTLNRNKPLTYEMAMQPQKIASHKSWNREVFISPLCYISNSICVSVLQFTLSFRYLGNVS